MILIKIILILSTLTSCTQLTPLNTQTGVDYWFPNTSLPVVLYRDIYPLSGYISTDYQTIVLDYRCPSTTLLHEVTHYLLHQKGMQKSEYTAYMMEALEMFRQDDLSNRQDPTLQVVASKTYTFYRSEASVYISRITDLASCR